MIPPRKRVMLRKALHCLKQQAAREYALELRAIELAEQIMKDNAKGE